MESFFGKNPKNMRSIFEEAQPEENGKDAVWIEEN
jgi:hypothetical protein